MPLANQVVKNNYHTHMYLCKHATGHVKDYVKEAIKHGFVSLGMSDHAPFAVLKDRSVRMYPEELPLYYQDLKEAIDLYGHKIKIWKGLEIEYFKDQMIMYYDLLEGLDYFALGQHYIPDSESRDGLRSTYTLNKPEHLVAYGNTLVEAMKTGLFRFVCHPDLMLYGYPEFDATAKAVSRQIIEAAKALNIPLEINANGIRKGPRELKEGQRYLYPRKEFWEIAKEVGIDVVISSDAHHPEELLDGAVMVAYEFASGLGIAVVEALDIQPKHR
jgi:histidinol-phosphatase (PHP family)